MAKNQQKKTQAKPALNMSISKAPPTSGPVAPKAPAVQPKAAVAPSPQKGLYIDPTSYLQNGSLTGNSFAQAAKASNAGTLNMRNFADSALGYALKNPTALDQSGRQALQDYYNNNPSDAVGLQSMQTAMGAGLSGKDFLNNLTNFRNNYTFSNFGPQLQNKLKVNNSTSTPSSSGGGSNPTQAQVAAAQNAQTQWNMSTQAPFEQAQTKSTNFDAAMADGRISKNEINARIAARGIKGKDKNNAYLRIADRWSGKGGTLGRGALGNYNKTYETSGKGVPWLRQFEGSQLGEILGAGLSGKQKSRYDLYNASKGVLDSQAFRKGDVFGRLKDGSFRAERPMASTTQKPSAPTLPATTNPNAPWNQRSQTTTSNTSTSPTSTSSNSTSSTPTTVTPAGPVPTAALPGYFGPGGDAFSGASKINRAKSRSRQLGIYGGLSTSNFNRSNPFFSALN